jgi:hypothetical protein
MNEDPDETGISRISLLKHTSSEHTVLTTTPTTTNTQNAIDLGKPENTKTATKWYKYIVEQKSKHFLALPTTTTSTPQEQSAVKTKAILKAK